MWGAFFFSSFAIPEPAVTPLLPDCPTRRHSAFGGVSPRVYSGIGVQSAPCGGERYLARNPARNL